MAMHEKPQKPVPKTGKRGKLPRTFRFERFVPKTTIASAEKNIARINEKLDRYYDIIESIERSGQRELAHDLGHYQSYSGQYLSLAEGSLAKAKSKKGNDYAPAFERIRKAQASMRFLEILLQRHSRNISFSPKPIRFQKLAGILKETAELAATDLVGRGALHFESSRAGGNKIVVVDAVELKRAIDNLVSNANAGASGPSKKGEAKISMELRGDRLSIVVADTGTGMPEEKVRKFYSGEIVKEGHYGLASARKSVEAHGGTIKLESREGVGTTFTIAIPLRK